MDWDKVKSELQKPLDPSAIKPPPKGKFGEYVDGLHVIREANRIFGEDGWSYTVTRLEQTHSAVVELESKKGPYQQLRCSFLCAVRVDVGGVIREGLAVGVGNGKPESAGDVIESAVKEAETDALKRALRTFGNTFGLALYEKDKDKREVAPPPRDPRNVADAMIKAISGVQHYRAWQDIIYDAGFKADGDWLGVEAPPMQAEVRKAIGDAKLRVDPASQSQ